MSAYRFVVFPPGGQPTVDEAANLAAMGSQLDGRIAWGRDRQTHALCVAFPAESFERALAASFDFQALIHRWESRGCAVGEKADFVKDPDALHPTAARNLTPGIHPLAAPVVKGAGVVASGGQVLFAKQQIAHQAVARARLAFDRTMRRHESLRRFASVAPYLAIAAGTLAILIAGWSVGVRLLESTQERRRETIERVADDAFHEAVEARPRGSDAEK